MSYVLLVDDNDDNLAFLRALIGGNGWSHKAAPHGAEALKKAQASPPLAVIADLLMPVMDGYTLLRLWKSDPKLHPIPFIVYSAAYTDLEDEQLATDLGADAFICKTVEPTELLLRLRALVSAAALVPGPAPRLFAFPEEARVSAYNERLVRKLEAKTLQLHATNQALLEEITKRREIASSQLAVLNSLTSNVALIDPSGNITAVNEAWRSFGRRNALTAANFAVNENYLRVCDAAQGADSVEARHAAAGIRAVLSGELKRFEIEYLCHGPSAQHWYRMQVTPMPDCKTGGAVIKHIDVTEARQAEQKLQESEAQYLLLLNSTAEGIYRLDTNGVCTFCNPTAARLLGYKDPSEVVGRSAHEHHHGRRPDGSPYPTEECPIHRVARAGRGTSADDAVFFRADGSAFPVEYWSYPILSGPDIEGTVVTFLDITRRRDLEEQFMQSQKMEAVGRLAGGVAHDFNNALQIILVNAELLDERLTGDPEGLGQNREILAAGRRAASLTQQLLALSRKQLLRPSRLDLNAVTHDIEIMLRRTIGEDITLSIDCTPALGVIEADRGQIEQALINLAVNARDAMRSGGNLFITTLSLKYGAGDSPPRAFIQAGSYSVVSVRDTGTGMDQATQARIFEPFFTTKEPGEGTGLGLSTVYAIMKQSRGFVTVDSRPGNGTEFRLYFPVVAGAPESLAPHESFARAPKGHETVLLVEDEQALRSVVGKMLRSHGYTVLDAEAGKAAIDLADNFPAPIDLLLTDVILPQISGPGVAGHLRASRPLMKVMYMSGYTQDFIAHHGHIDRPTVLLEKPFTINSLLQKIRETLDGDLAHAASTVNAP